MHLQLSALGRFPQARGLLTVGEVGRELPFAPQRFFIVTDVPTGEVRGAHAHLACEQFLVCVTGSIDVRLDDGERSQSFSLSAPDAGLYIPAGIWGEQLYKSDGAALLVFASLPYDPEDYVSDYEQFKSLRKNRA